MHRHLTRNTAILCSFFAIYAVGCSKHNDAPQPVASSTASAAASAGLPDAGGSSSMSEPVPGEGLGGHFAREAKNRPGLKPNADDIFAALGRAGVGVPKQTQSMGSTYKAAYCTGGYSADSLIALTVCEYANEADAKAGRDYSISLFPKMTNRTVVAHKTNTLTIVDQKSTDASKAEAKKANDAFNAT
jgi:hypothetical protein